MCVLFFMYFPTHLKNIMHSFVVHNRNCLMKTSGLGFWESFYYVILIHPKRKRKECLGVQGGVGDSYAGLGTLAGEVGDS